MGISRSPQGGRAMPLQMKYFVLKPAGNDRYAHASRWAMKTYAVEIAEVDPSLSDSLMQWYNDEEEHYRSFVHDTGMI